MVYLGSASTVPTLHWIGKEKVVAHHLDVPFHVLKHQYGFTENGKQELPSGSGNKIIHGDNLVALKALLPEYEGRVKCIYIDPPYNTGNENWVYNDNVNDPRLAKWLHEVVGKEGEDLSRHDKWLCMMYPRLKLLHKLLSADGAIFISIDDNELANLKLIMDEIFGAANFVDFFSWQKSDTPANLSYKTKKAVEYVVCYQKQKNRIKFKGLQKESGSDNPLIKPGNSTKTLLFRKEWVKTNFKEDVRFAKGVYGTKNNPVELLDDIEIKSGVIQQDFSLRANFIWLQEKLAEEVANGTEIRIKTKTLVPSYDKANYEPEVPWNLIDTSFGVGTTQQGGDLLRSIFAEKVFDFPKPPSLIEYLVDFLCERNDIVLDSFAGSGTTAHAVLNLNKRDGGNRKFILVQVDENDKSGNPVNIAETITSERVRRVIQGYGDTPGTGGGFDYYELGPTLFTPEGELNELAGQENIFRYIWYSETHQRFFRVQSRNEYLLGWHNGTVYYFAYDPDGTTTLDHKFLSTLDPQFYGEQYIIYADNCLLSREFMEEKNIIFKKIPRDITKL